MKYSKVLILLCVLPIITGSCAQTGQDDFVLVFGSCNNQDLVNHLWPSILEQRPDLWVWGGDNIYSDTYDPNKMWSNYEKQSKDTAYAELMGSVPIMATWDDHDYGKNDAGAEYQMKKTSQQLFLDFLQVDKDDVRRKREGIYSSRLFTTKKGSINVIILDTRYFRTPLTEDKDSKKRFKPNPVGQGTILGDVQWKWLEAVLKESKADFNVVVSSIQLLSSEHGFETWGNFPHEQDRFYDILQDSEAKNVIVLSGDRHVSEFSKKEMEGLMYPLIDFTSSGLTHAYQNFKGEPNQYRIGEVVFTESFGVLRFDLEKKEVQMEMRGKDNVLLQKIRQVYE